jgi:hypothetical protein
MGYDGARFVGGPGQGDDDRCPMFSSAMTDMDVPVSYFEILGNLNTPTRLPYLGSY